MGLADQRWLRKASHWFHTQSGQSPDGHCRGKRYPHCRVGCLGACLLSELPEPEAGLRNGVVERGELERSGKALRLRKEKQGRRIAEYRCFNLRICGFIFY